MAFVQGAATSTDGTTATTIAIAFGSNVAAGNLIYSTESWSIGTAATATVTDSLGNAETQIGANVDDTPDNQRGAHFYAKNIVGGADTVTATFTESVGFRGIIVHEHSGLDTTAPLDQNVGNFQATPGTGADGVTSTAKTTTANGETIVGAAWDTGNTGVNPYSAGTNFTIRTTVGTATTLGGATESLVQSTSGSIAATFTSSRNEATVCFMATFKAAAGGAAASGAGYYLRRKHWSAVS